MGGVDEEEEEEEIEEVDAFSPLVGGPGEIIEEQILEDEEATTPTAEVHSPPDMDIHSPSAISPRNTVLA
jgi:hypothetical protein